MKENLWAEPSQSKQQLRLDEATGHLPACQQQDFAFTPIILLQQNHSSGYQQWQETQLLFLPLPKNITHHRHVRRIYPSNNKHDQHGTQKDREMSAHDVPGDYSGGCINTVPGIHVKVPVHLKNRRKPSDIYQPCSSCFYQGKKCFTAFAKLPEAVSSPPWKWS